MSQSTPDTLGKYQIIREIARSNDIVYEAYDPVMNRRCAVKELAMPSGASAQQKDDRIKRFMREAKAAGSLVHPNIVTVYEVSEESNRHYLVMEFLDGDTLRKEIEDKSTMDTKEATKIAMEVLKGLQFAHDHGVVHRDVKPENVQILESGAIKLTDFGIARLTFEPNLTMDGQVFGTPSYMSPEQINGKDIDARSDIFSVGVLIYEMVTGKKPFTGDNVVAITHSILNVQPTPPPNMPGNLWMVIQKAMGKTPQERYATAKEMLSALEATLYSTDQNSAGSTTQNPAVVPPPVLLSQGMGQHAQQASQSLGSALTFGTPQTPYGGVAPQAPGQPYQPGQPIQTPYNPGGVPQSPIQHGQPFNAPMPVYLPPKRKPMISDDTIQAIWKFFVAIILFGALVGGLLLGINYMAEQYSTPVSQVTDELNENSLSELINPPASSTQEQPTSSTTPPENQADPNEIQWMNAQQALKEADRLVRVGVISQEYERREHWDHALRLYSSVLDQEGYSERTANHAATAFLQAASELRARGDEIGSRDALYKARSLATQGSSVSREIDSWLAELGA